MNPHQIAGMPKLLWLKQIEKMGVVYISDASLQTISCKMKLVNFLDRNNLQMSRTGDNLNVVKPINV